MQERAEETIQKIKLEALRLFLIHGYQNVSLAQIAKESGISKGGLTHHFDSKTDILEAALVFFFEKAQSRKESPPVTLKEVIWYLMDGVSKISDRLEEITGVYDSEMNYHRLFIDTMQILPEFNLVDRYFRPSLDYLNSVINQAINAKTIRSDIDCENLALQILSMIEGLYILTFYLDVDIASRTISMVENLWRGISV
jgi:AcrR family transcriptional regulator